MRDYRLLNSFRSFMYQRATKLIAKLDPQTAQSSRDLSTLLCTPLSLHFLEVESSSSGPIPHTRTSRARSLIGFDSISAS
jgi:hypothetical protein